MKKDYFICGCCGAGFDSTIEKQRPFDQDEGYGICDPCAADIEARNEREWQRLENQVASHLNEQNRERFLSMDLPLRRGFILQMLDDGVVKFAYTKR